MVSSPPSVRFKLLLFGVFVVLVAVVTFMVLYMLKPFESKRHPPPVPEQEASAEEKSPPEAAVKKAPAEGAQKEAAEATPEVGNERPDAPDPEPAPAGDGKHSVAAPVFEQKSGKWQITFKSDNELKFKHFTLEDPPRLAVDFLRATYSGEERLLDCPIPFISKIRVGEKPEYTRYVIDFSEDKLPKYEAVSQAEGVVITFEN